jgi:hypothetical protein
MDWTKINIPVLVGLVIYGLVWVIIYFHRNKEMTMSHSLGLLGILFTIVNSVFFLKAILFHLEPLAEYFYAPLGAFSFSLIVTVSWAIKKSKEILFEVEPSRQGTPISWNDLNPKSESNGNP